jgi:arabinose-5-phosphate isomerase
MKDHIVLKELLQKEKSYLDYFFDKIDLIAAERIVQVLHSCQGVMIFSGMGKSGLVAEKIAMTMTSTGSRALFLSPSNALHGDIGIVSEKDLFVIISKSGESEELFNLIPTLRNRRVKIVGIVSNAQSRLAKACDLFIDLPLQQELCPFDMVPTTSAVIQLIFGDLLAVALMRLKNFSLDEYAQNHPAGRIGKRISLRVADLMITGEGVPICSPHDKLVDSLVELSNKRCGCILVVDEARSLQGIFTDGDLRRSLQKHGASSLNLQIGDLMTKTARWIDPQSLAWDAMRKMEGDQKNAITVLPVLESETKVVGLIKLHDIVQSGL